MASIDLLDVNVWVALSTPGHPHHQRATLYWARESQARIAFNSHIMLGLVRVTTNAALFSERPLTIEAAWEVYRAWRRDKAVTFIDEPTRCHAILGDAVANGLVRPRTWSDAYLAAFAESGGLRLISFDSDFSRFPRLNWLQLQQ